jgi:hypothetical protein
VEQCGVGEYAIEMAIQQIGLKKILLPHFAATMSTPLKKCGLTATATIVDVIV